MSGCFSIDLKSDKKSLMSGCEKFKADEPVKEKLKYADCDRLPGWVLIISIVLAFVIIFINTVVIFKFFKEMSQ